MLGDGSKGTGISGNAAPFGETRATPVDGSDGVAGMVNGATKSRGFVVLGYNFLPNSPV